VGIKLPLVREKQGSVDSPYIPTQELAQLLPSTPSVVRTVAILRPINQNTTNLNRTALGSFAVREEIRTSVLKTMLKWLHMRSFNAGQDCGHAEYVVFLADEIFAIEDDSSMKTSKAIALLPHNLTRGQTEDLLAQKFAIFEIITAPFGPRKLARAVAACEATASRRQKSAGDSVEYSAMRDTSATNAETYGNENRNPKRNSRMAQNTLADRSNCSSAVHAIREPAMTANRADGGQEAILSPETCTESYRSKSSISTNAAEPPSQDTEKDITTSRTPSSRGNAHLLLVDDNKINLSLLETFVKRYKRKLAYDCAENGLLAVEAARQNPSGYDIIFMDISMPEMDGLEATREIRKLESERIATLGEADAPSPALVVALTGLANGRDQTDAFVSGVDLFMTKPTKFKEIGSLIEEWYEKGSRHFEVRPKSPHND
jgi:CheY-like chemotaxis protein